MSQIDMYIHFYAFIYDVLFNGLAPVYIQYVCVLLFYVHCKHLRSCWDDQLT